MQIRICEDELMKKMFLEDCCEILDSQRVPITAANRAEGSYPYYGANGVQDYVDDYIFDDELVLLAEDGGNFGSKTKPIAYRVSGKCWVNNHAHVLKPKNGLDVDFLCYSLMFYNTDGLVNGATRQKLTQATMRKMLIPDLSKELQLEIVNQLNRIVAIKNLRLKEIQKLDNLVKARFVELFGNLKTNSKDWHIRTFDELTCLITDGEHVTPRRTEKGIFLLSARNILNHSIQLENVDYIDQNEYERISKRVVPQEGDVLISCSGTVGRCCIVPAGLKFQMVRSVALLRFKKDINPIFAEYMVSSDFLQGQIRSSKTASSQANLFQGKIKALKGVVPPLELQNEFADFVIQVDKSKAAVQKALDETQLLFDSLMQEYFG